MFNWLKNLIGDANGEIRCIVCYDSLWWKSKHFFNNKLTRVFHPFCCEDCWSSMTTERKLDIVDRYFNITCGGFRSSLIDILRQEVKQEDKGDGDHEQETV